MIVDFLLLISRREPGPASRVPFRASGPEFGSARRLRSAAAWSELTSTANFFVRAFRSSGVMLQRRARAVPSEELEHTRPSRLNRRSRFTNRQFNRQSKIAKTSMTARDRHLARTDGRPPLITSVRPAGHRVHPGLPPREIALGLMVQIQPRSAMPSASASAMLVSSVHSPGASPCGPPPR